MFSKKKQKELAFWFGWKHYTGTEALKMYQGLIEAELSQAKDWRSLQTMVDILSGVVDLPYNYLSNLSRDLRSIYRD
jgi:hypothetical protein